MRLYDAGYVERPTVCDQPDVGGEIWADVSSSITHVGSYDFSGRFLDYLHAIR